jgi:cyclopropane-fatty-acyl-phospholipid synthase
MINVSLAVNDNASINIKDKLIRKYVLKLLAQLQCGYITIQDPLEFIYCGKSSENLKAEIKIHNLAFYSSVFLKGSIGFAISYLHEHVETDNLTNLLLILAKNLAIVKKSESNIASTLFHLIQSFFYNIKPNTIKYSKHRILAHYDLSNELFKLFLDDNMSYSSLIFRNPDDSLEQAADYKICTLLERLQVKEKEHLLEIGTGWGALAITAATKYDCKVTTTTISDKQYQFTKERINALNLGNKIALLNQDYRTLSGKYNKIVSVEMIEAVGHHYLADYFKICSNMLHDDGLFALQCITIQDQEFERAKTEVDFIKKFIFPGGCLPSMQRIMSIVVNSTDLSLISCHDITYDYALTLEKWRDKFIRHKKEILNLGFDNYFMKMWEYYFCYCEAGFLNRNIMCLQLVFAKPGYKDARQIVNIY